MWFIEDFRPQRQFCLTLPSPKERVLTSLFFKVLSPDSYRDGEDEGGLRRLGEAKMPK